MYVLCCVLSLVSCCLSIDGSVNHLVSCYGWCIYSPLRGCEPSKRVRPLAQFISWGEVAVIYIPNFSGNPLHWGSLSRGGCPLEHSVCRRWCPLANSTLGWSHFQVQWKSHSFCISFLIESWCAKVYCVLSFFPSSTRWFGNTSHRRLLYFD